MWLDAASVTHDSVAQLIRFNEAIDQILAEGVLKFTERMDRDADLFTASVGHDLSNPVNAISMSAHVLVDNANLTEKERSALIRIRHAASRLPGMLIELRDFARTRLGGLVRIDRESCDVATIIRSVVDEVAAVYTGRGMKVECRGNLTAFVDERRIAQLVSNLVANALQHGSRDTDVTVIAAGDDDWVTMEIHNTGPAIEPARLKILFDPLSASPRSPIKRRWALA